MVEVVGRLFVGVIALEKVKTGVFMQFSANILKTIMHRKELSIDEMILMIRPTKVFYWVKVVRLLLVIVLEK